MEPAIKISVAEGFQEMIWGDGIAASQISDSAGDLEDAIVGTSAEVQISHRVLEEFVAPVIQSAVLLELCMTHASIAGDLLSPTRLTEAFLLDSTC